jgi:DNA-binding MarR family transcriptional regulator
MSKPSSRSTLYKLIEAGQLAHKALVVPLHEKGLEPGDDAVLFALGKKGTTEARIADDFGITLDMLQPRLQRLVDRDIIARQAVGPHLEPGIVLTDRGKRLRNSLADNWAQLEEALMGELKPKQRKRLGEALTRFIDLLRL